jgi:acyl carrier protein
MRQKIENEKLKANCKKERYFEMTFDKVKEIIVDTLGADEADVTAEAAIIDDLGADSLDVVELNMALEDAYDIKIADEEIAEMKTVGDIVAYIDEKVAAAE